jgi:hypothetical protein
MTSASAAAAAAAAAISKQYVCTVRRYIILHITALKMLSTAQNQYPRQVPCKGVWVSRQSCCVPAVVSRVLSLEVIRHSSLRKGACSSMHSSRLVISIIQNIETVSSLD